MKKIYNDIIPFTGYKAVTLWPIIFIRNGCTFNSTDERHEDIHGEQQKEVLPVAALVMLILVMQGCGWWSLFALPLYFYIYGIMYLVRLIWHGSHRKVYRNIPFEQEAYDNERKTTYLDRRRPFAWLWYIGKTTFTNN